jgi:hypothetical protein
LACTHEHEDIILCSFTYQSQSSHTHTITQSHNQSNQNRKNKQQQIKQNNQGSGPDLLVVIGKVLQVDLKALGHDTLLSDVGLDSLSSAVAHAALCRATGETFPLTEMSKFTVGKLVQMQSKVKTSASSSSASSVSDKKKSKKSKNTSSANTAANTTAVTSTSSSSSSLSSVTGKTTLQPLFIKEDKEETFIATNTDKTDDPSSTTTSSTSDYGSVQLEQSPISQHLEKRRNASGRGSSSSSTSGTGSIGSSGHLKHGIQSSDDESDDSAFITQKLMSFAAAYPNRNVASIEVNDKHVIVNYAPSNAFKARMLEAVSNKNNDGNRTGAGIKKIEGHYYINDYSNPMQHVFTMYKEDRSKYLWHNKKAGRYSFMQLAISLMHSILAIILNFSTCFLGLPSYVPMILSLIYVVVDSFIDRNEILSDYPILMHHVLFFATAVFVLFMGDAQDAISGSLLIASFEMSTVFHSLYHMYKKDWIFIAFGITFFVTRVVFGGLLLIPMVVNYFNKQLWIALFISSFSYCLQLYWMRLIYKTLKRKWKLIVVRDAEFSMHTAVSMGKS